jgi:hypothetical protein
MNFEFPFDRLPAVLQGAVGILVTPDTGELVTLPEDPPEQNVVDVRYELKLSDAGELTGQLKGTFSGIYAARSRAVLELEEQVGHRADPAVPLFGAPWRRAPRHRSRGVHRRARREVARERGRRHRTAIPELLPEVVQAVRAPG